MQAQRFISLYLSIGLVMRFENENLSNLYSLWLCGSALFGQGIEEFPRSLSSRILIMTWWMFVFLTTSCYSANLAASLTIKNFEIGINSVEELLLQTDINYGTKKGNVAFELLKNSDYYIHNKIAENIESQNMFLYSQEYNFDQYEKPTAFIFDATNLKNPKGRVKK